MKPMHFKTNQTLGNQSNEDEPVRFFKRIQWHLNTVNYNKSTTTTNKTCLFLYNKQAKDPLVDRINQGAILNMTQQHAYIKYSCIYI